MSRTFFDFLVILAMGGVMAGALNAQAYEVDAFTHRDQVYNDVSQNIDQAATFLIKAVLTRLNTENGLKKNQCDPDLLRLSLAAVLDTNTSDVTELFTRNAYHQYGKTHPDTFRRTIRLMGGQGGAKNHYEYEKLEADVGKELKLWRQIPLQDPDNIYSERDGAMYTQIGKIFAGVSWLCCSANLLISGHQVGLDKVGHLFENGYDLYLIQKKHGLKEALAFSRSQEEGTWGLWLSGVKSYGDMSANYDGIRFWTWLLDGVDEKGPAISCKDGVYALTQDFHIKDYVTDAWDEAINCSTFTEKVAKKTLPKILKNTNGVGCPMSLESCVTLTKIYPKEVAKEILHPRCLHAQKILDAMQDLNANSCSYTPEETMISKGSGSFFKALSVGQRRNQLNDTVSVSLDEILKKAGYHEE